MSGQIVDLGDAERADYPQPQCEVCGRFARRGRDRQWTFACLTWTTDGWEHR